MPPTGPHPDLDWDSYAEALARRVRAVVAETGHKQLELAGLAGVDRNTVGNIVRAQGFGGSKGNPRLQSVYRLARALGVAPALLLPNAHDLVGVMPREASPDFGWSDLVIEVRREISGGEPSPTS